MDLLLTAAGFGVGIVVGLTGMGGGALMTPLLVLAFGVPPLAAVSSDLVASAVMKPFGGWVHARRGTVNWALVRWLCVGSVPAAFAGVLLTRQLPGDESVQHVIQYALGAALVLAAVGLIAKARASRRTSGVAAHPSIVVRPLPTALLGAGGAAPGVADPEPPVLGGQDVHRVTHRVVSCDVLGDVRRDLGDRATRVDERVARPRR